MKKFCLPLLLMLILIIMFGCKVSDKPADDERRYACDAILDGIYYFDDEPDVVYPYGNKFYEASYNTGNVGYREPENMEYHLLYNVGEEAADDIYVDESGIYTVGGHVVYHIDFYGNVIEKTELPEFEVVQDGYCISASENYITVCYRYVKENGADFENKIYVIDRKTNEITQYDYQKSHDNDTLGRIIPTSNGSKFVIIGTFQAYDFDAATGKIELLYERANSHSNDYSKNDNCLYFFEKYMSGEINFGRTQLPDGEKTIVRSTDSEYFYPEIKSLVEDAGREAKENWFSGIFYTESGYILWDKLNKVICVFTEKVNETGEEITVLYRYSPSTVETLQPDYEVEFGWMHGAMERMNTQFEEENKIAVNAKGYAHDKFVENLRLKLLAGDDDYDVVMLEHADELLASILNYNLYLPLETYDSISSGFDKYFDGVRDVMSYDGHIFGIPYYLTVDGFTSEDNTIDKLNPDYTLDDFWNFCEESGSSRILFCTTLTNQKPFYYIISSILEDGMKKGEISRDTILECIETYMKYRKAGSLNLDPPGNGPLRIIGGIGGTLSSNFDEREYKGLRSLPTYDGKRYVNIESMAYINSKTKNTDFAVQYLSMLVSDDYLAWITEYQKSYLAKDKDSYFYLSLGENKVANGYKKIKVTGEENVYMRGCNPFQVENGGDIFVNAAPRIYTGSLEDMINEVYDELNEGKLTAEEAADKIYSEASYQLME